MNASTPPGSAATPIETVVLDHAATYHRFMLGVKWAAIHLAVLAVLFTLWFATPAGFVGALFAAVVVAAVAVYAMTHGLAHSTERDNPHALEQG